MAKQCGRWAGHLYARTEAIGSDVPRGMSVANRLCPDENLLRQNASIWPRKALARSARNENRLAA
ncbi:hypothetical protein GFL21_31840 [Rhizobium anhuiense]|nr:hypothetical protein [Rhizobium anhuiense]RUL95660.1 hypothetical protein EEQ99_33690 [Rhizobium anhuiense]